MTDNQPKTAPQDKKQLKYGWTTGACATAATKAALHTLLTGQRLGQVTISLPQGQTPSFLIETQTQGDDWQQVGIIKDAGDDPDVTHGALISARVKLTGEAGKSGIIFKAGSGVGTVTRPGLPLAVGEPAINPIPRQMMTQVITQLCSSHNIPANVSVEISVKDGEILAKSTLNERLGIIGGISILGTTGIVVPYSCSAWIHSIHRGIDVAKATGADHITTCVGSTSERMIQQLYPTMKEECFIDMGDFVGGTLKYIRKVPVEKVTIAGGIGKFCKLAKGERDLHSKRSRVDISWLSDIIAELGGSADLIQKAKSANTALEVFSLAQEQNLPFADYIASLAKTECYKILRMSETDIKIEVMICDRQANLVGHAPF